MVLCTFSYLTLEERREDPHFTLPTNNNTLSSLTPFPPTLSFFLSFFLSLLACSPWQQIGVACRLLHASDAMLELFGPILVDALRISAIFFAGTIALCLIPNVLVWLAREFCTISVIEWEE